MHRKGRLKLRRVLWAVKKAKKVRVKVSSFTSEIMLIGL
jgi:hypothetical protein